LIRYDYVDRVRELAEELASHEIEVELDQWFLKVYSRNANKDELVDLVEKIKQTDNDVTSSSRLNFEVLLVLMGTEQIATGP
jgi:hypothetical protein